VNFDKETNEKLMFGITVETYTKAYLELYKEDVAYEMDLMEIKRRFCLKNFEENESFCISRCLI
jgi:hypothetical protein